MIAAVLGALPWIRANWRLLAIGLLVAALGVIAAGIRRVWRLWMAAIDERRQILAAVRKVEAQVHPNSGSSLRDAVDATQLAVDATQLTVQRHSEQLQILGTEITALARTVSRLPRRASDQQQPPRRRWWRCR